MKKEIIRNIKNNILLIISMVIVFINVSTTLTAQQQIERIINGYLVLNGEHPAMAAVQILPVIIPNGGGVLIHPEWVLTAAHVVERQTDVEVTLKTVDYLDIDSAEVISVDEIIIHSEFHRVYDSTLAGYFPVHDIALLHLSTPSTQTPMTLIDYEVFNGTNTTVMGWGSTSMDSLVLPNQLYAVDINIVDCANNSYPMATDSMMCAGLHDESGYSGAWIGDSGGPLFIQDGGFDVLVGIVSWGIVNDPNINSTVYTDILEYLEWIGFESDYIIGSGLYWGCTDPNANNYNPDANAEDGSCIYTVNIRFANRDESGNNLFGTLEVDGVYSSIQSEQIKELEKNVNYTIRTHHEYRSSNTKKHHRWNEIYDEFKMQHNNEFDQDDIDIAAFRDIFEITFDNNLPLYPAQINIQDPWYKDTNGNQPGNTWVDIDGQYKVFLDQDPQQPGHKYYTTRTQLLLGGNNEYEVFHRWVAIDAGGNENQSLADFTTGNSTETVAVYHNNLNKIEAEYYTVSLVGNGLTLTEDNGQLLLNAPQVTTLDNREWVFYRWTSTGANVQDPISRESSVSITADNAVITAEYKGHMFSEVNDNPTGVNNGRRLTKGPDGELYLIYEDLGDIWYTYSTDDGNTWSFETLISQGDGDNSNPSMCSFNGSFGPAGYIPFIHVVWVRNKSAINYRKLTSELEPIEAVGFWFPGINSNIDSKPGITLIEQFSGGYLMPKPIIAINHDGGGFVPNNRSLIDCFIREDGAWNNLGLNVNGDFPSIATNISGGNSKFDFGLTYEYGDEIYFIHWENEFSPAARITPDLWDYQGYGAPNLTYYYDKAHIVWEAYNWVSGVNMIHYRTWSNGELSTTFTLPSQGDDCTNPTIGTSQNNPVTIYYGWSNSIARVDMDDMLLTEQDGTGHHPNMIPYNNRGAVWTHDAGQYHTITSDYIEPEPESHPIRRMTRFQYTFEESGFDGNDGYMNLDLLELTVDEQKLFLKEKQKTESISLSVGETELKYVMFSVHHNLDLAKVDGNLKLLNFAFSGGDEKYSVSSLKFNQVVDMKSDQKEKITELPVTIVNLPINTGKVVVENGEMKPEVLDILLNQEEVDLLLGKRTAVNHQVYIPEEFRLYQNYPNPFNPVTAIRFDLPEQTELKLIIVDITGRAVQTILSGTKKAGQHLVYFDASHLSTGVYFYVLQANKYREVKKMTFIK